VILKMKKILSVISVVMMLVASLSTVSIVLADNVDQECEPGNSLVISVMNGYYGNEYAQAFVPDATELTKAELWMFNGGGNPGYFKVSIRNDRNGADLTSVTKTDDEIGNSPIHWEEFDFPDISVTVGSTYYLVFKGPETLNSPDVYTVKGHSGGSAYPNGNFWQTTNGPGTWEELDADVSFRTYTTGSGNPDSQRDQYQPYIELGFQVQLGDEKWAQEFIPTLNRLDYAKLWMLRSYGMSVVGDVKVSIKTSYDGGTTLGYKTIPASSIDDETISSYVFDFDDDIALNPGDSYYMVWELTQDQSLNHDVALYFSSSDRYSGDCYWRNPNTGGWEIKNNRDFTFETWGYDAGPEIQLTPNSHNYDNIDVGDCSAPFSFTLKNIGGGTATGSVYLGGSNSGQFVITFGGGDFSLAEGASKSVKIKFCPTSSGNKNAILKADGSNCNDDTSSLAGYGIPNYPILELTPELKDYGNVYIGDCSSFSTFVLENSIFITR
jgi:hypothetical protein